MKIKNHADIIIKKGKGGKPKVEVVVPKGTPLKVSQELERQVYAEIPERLGLGKCPNCRSGIDMFIRERFGDVLRVNLDSL